MKTIQEQFININPGTTETIHLDDIQGAVAITVGRKAKVTIIEDPQNSDAKNRSILLNAKSQSTIDYLTLTTSKNTHHYTFRANLEEGSTLNYHFFGKAEDDLDIRAIITHRGEGTTGNIIAGLDARQDSITKINLVNNHEAPHTSGNISFRGLGQESSQGIINGLIKITQKAPHTNSFLSQKILLLSDKSKIQAEPNLEILNNDVKASHSATISSLDELTLYYMQSRGLDEKTAQKMLINGFFTPLFNAINNKNIRKLLETNNLRNAKHYT